MPTPPFNVSKQTLQEIAQSLLEIKKMGRSIESTADAFSPFANDEVVQTLVSIGEHGATAAAMANKLYHSIAKDALGA